MGILDSMVKFDKQPPQGWKQALGLEEYAQLDDERKRYYKPLYAKYRTKKIPDYDDTGQFVGYRSVNVGIGQPIGYEYVGYIVAKMIDDLLNSNVLMQRVLKKS